MAISQAFQPLQLSTLCALLYLILSTCIFHYCIPNSIVKNHEMEELSDKILRYGDVRNIRGVHPYIH